MNLFHTNSTYHRIYDVIIQKCTTRFSFRMTFPASFSERESFILLYTQIHPVPSELRFPVDKHDPNAV